MLSSRFLLKKDLKVYMRKSFFLFFFYLYLCFICLFIYLFFPFSCYSFFFLNINSGLSSGIFGIAVTNGVYYYCYEAVKAIFEKTKGVGKSMTTGESMLAGALAGSAVVLATHPIWTINVIIIYIYTIVYIL